ncbi:MAG: TetR/AcrR family transcriptional regulator [Candidatus Nanopelagicales bacterium]
MEEIAAAAEVSKPVVYEHFGGKEGLYAVVVDRELQTLLKRITEALTGEHPRLLLELWHGAVRLHRGRYRRIPGAGQGLPVPTGSFASLIVEVAAHVEHSVGPVSVQDPGYNTKLAPMYSQMLLSGWWR